MPPFVEGKEKVMKEDKLWVGVKSSICQQLMFIGSLAILVGSCVRCKVGPQFIDNGQASQRFLGEQPARQVIPMSIQAKSDAYLSGCSVELSNPSSEVVLSVFQTVAVILG